MTGYKAPLTNNGGLPMMPEYLSEQLIFIGSGLVFHYIDEYQQ